MKKFQKSSLLIFLALALAFSAACGTDDGPKDKTDTGVDVESDVGGDDVDDQDVDDKDVDEQDVDDKDVDEQDVDDQDVDDQDADDQDTDPVDNGYPPNAADSALIEELLEDRDATPSFTGVLVTFTKETYGNDSAGFFIQAEKDGPAAFVQVDPASFDPPIEAGNVIAFDVVALKAENQSFERLEIAEIANLEVLGDFTDVPAFVQNINQAADLVTGFADYSLELVAGDFTVTGAIRGAGTGFVSYPVSTEALAEGVVVRFPTELGESLSLTPDCKITIAGTPIWSHNGAPQPSAWTTDDFELSECALTAVKTQATSATTVEITFSRAVNPSTFLADGSQFLNASADEDFAISAASLSGNVVTLTTSAQTADETYVIAISDTLEDNFGNELEGGLAVDFTGFNDAVQAPTAAGEVIFTEVMARSISGQDPGEYIEIYNPSATVSYDLNGCFLSKQSGATGNPTSDEITSTLVIAPGQYLVFAKEADQLGTRVADAILSFGGGLGNNATTFLKVVCDSVDIAVYNYPNPTLGQSTQKSPNSDTWCVTPKEDDTYEYATGKFGTPGAANFQCPD